MTGKTGRCRPRPRPVGLPLRGTRGALGPGPSRSGAAVWGCRAGLCRFQKTWLRRRWSGVPLTSSLHFSKGLPAPCSCRRASAPGTTLSWAVLSVPCTRPVWGGAGGRGAVRLSPPSSKSSAEALTTPSSWGRTVSEGDPQQVSRPWARLAPLSQDARGSPRPRPPREGTSGGRLQPEPCLGPQHPEL